MSLSTAAPGGYNEPTAAAPAGVVPEAVARAIGLLITSMAAGDALRKDDIVIAVSPEACHTAGDPSGTPFCSKSEAMPRANFA